MNDMQKGIIMLIKSAITGEAQPLPEEFSIDEAYGFIMKHKIMMLAYDGAVRCGIPKENPTMQKLFQSYIQGLFYSEKQMKAVSEIYSAFDKNGIDYLPLKGCNMKYLYPKPELRSMGDADILLKEEQEQEASVFLKKMGYKRINDIEHHGVWHSDSLHLEIHRKLFSEDNAEYASYYGNGWKFGKKSEGKRFAFSHEDELVYITAHFASHCRNGGIGIRHAVDFYVYKKAFPELDEKYIAGEFEKMHLLKFYNNVCGLMESWFEGKPAAKETEVLSELILSSGDWGNYRNVFLSSKIKEKQNKKKNNYSKIGSFIKAVFPPLETMRINYPILHTHPIFLPFFWVKKWLEILFLRRESLALKLKTISTTDNEEISEYEEKLKTIGIDFTK
ncbi:MAG: nucleotidyltransferase family protein [Oscillospiraceae bacterium]|nr:nucleotidyltransferase family protein [Oscillospiraceae bacterium]